MGEHSSSEWQGIVCRHGLLLVQDERSLQKSVMMKGGVWSDTPFDVSHAREVKAILLGAPRDSVLLAADGNGLAQPPIKMRLSDELTDALAKPSFQRAVAMTH